MSVQVEVAPVLSVKRPDWSRRAVIAVRVLLGCLLLTAAGLKLYGLNVTAVPRVGWFATQRVQVAAAVWEMVLGFWLLNGSSRAWSWLAAGSTFIAFAGNSGYFGWVGVANCGCFGVLRASPWAVFGVDIAALVLLAVTRPEFKTYSFGFPAGFRAPAFVGSAVLVALAGVGWWAYGSPAAALARLRGDVFGTSPGFVDFGVGIPGQIVDRSVEVHNWSDVPVRLIGGTSDCSCVTTVDLPLTIQAGEAKPVTVRMRIPNSKFGVLTRTAELWTDYGDQGTIRLQIGCRVVE
jgi:hypothetical protein